MKRLALVLIWMLPLAGCSPSQPVSSPTPDAGPLVARHAFCDDWTASNSVLAQPLAALNGADAAEPFDRVVATFEADALVSREAGDTVTASQIDGFAQALAAIADDIRPPAPTDPDALAKWKEATELRRAGLSQAAEDASQSLKSVCFRLGRR